MAVEETLILFDEATGLEQFVREATFRDASSNFGFVVPTPERPVVTVGAPLSTPSRRWSRFTPWSAQPVPGEGPPPSATLVFLPTHGAGLPTVRVISRDRVASFIAFVLEANDPQAMKGWLEKHHFVTTPASDGWLQHCVGPGFYFAALRYEPPAGPQEGTATRTETIRITFRTPLPYYPYFEPDSTTAEPGTLPQVRELAVWLVSGRRYVPVSTFAVRQQRLWKRPLEEWNASVTFKDWTWIGNELRSLIPDEGGVSAIIQRFEDQKSHRDGLGDIVFVPEAPVSVGAKRWSSYKKIMATLDSSLGGLP